MNTETNLVPLSAQDVRTQVNLIQEVMKNVMQKDQHYGIIPGTNAKPSLYKAGAEKLCMTFRLAPDIEVQDLSTQMEAKYRVIVRMTGPTGNFLGSGVGEASSAEEKYGWRGIVCEEEFEMSPENMKRIKFKKGREGYYSQKQVRTNPADQANTILKMAKKRAFVDAVLTVTAASDIFTQDLEDLEREGPERETRSHHAETNATPHVNESEPLISEAQAKRLFAIAKQKGITNDMLKSYLKDHYKIEHTKDIKKKDYEAICAYIGTPKTDEEPTDAQV